MRAGCGIVDSYRKAEASSRTRDNFCGKERGARRLRHSRLVPQSGSFASRTPDNSCGKDVVPRRLRHSRLVPQSGSFASRTRITLAGKNVVREGCGIVDSYRKAEALLRALRLTRGKERGARRLRHSHSCRKAEALLRALRITFTGKNVVRAGCGIVDSYRKAEASLRALGRKELRALSQRGKHAVRAGCRKLRFVYSLGLLAGR